MLTKATRDALAEVLLQHLPFPPDLCRCGYSPTGPPDYRLHVADALLVVLSECQDA